MIENVGADPEASQDAVEPPPGLKPSSERDAARDLTHEQAARREDSGKVGDIGDDGGPGGQMLQHEDTVDQVEVVGGEDPEIGMSVENEVAIQERRVQLPGGGDHGCRDVDAIAVLEVGRQGARQPADTAAEVERARAPGRIAQALHVRPEARDLLLAGTEELVEIPPAEPALREGENAPARIKIAQVFPVPLMPPERRIHDSAASSRTASTSRAARSQENAAALARPRAISSLRSGS